MIPRIDPSLLNCLPIDPELYAKCTERLQAMAQPRISAGGRVCVSRLDETLMLHSDIIRDLMTLVNKCLSREEEYRVIANTIHNTHEASNLLNSIKAIYERD